MEKGTLNCTRLGVDRALVTVLHGEEGGLVSFHPGSAKATDLTSDVVERSISPSPSRRISADEPGGSRRTFDVSRRVVEAKLSPFFERRPSREMNVAGSVPETTVVCLHQCANMRDEFEEGVEVVDGHLDDTPRPEEETDVGGELTIGPVGTVQPRQLEFLDCLVRKAGSLVGEVESNTAPFHGRHYDRFETVASDVVGFVDSDVSGRASFEEDLGVVEDIFLGTDENDVVDVGVGLAAATFEVQEEQRVKLSTAHASTLTHAQTVGAEVVLPFTEAEVAADLGIILELVVV